MNFICLVCFLLLVCTNVVVFAQLGKERTPEVEVQATVEVVMVEQTPTGSSKAEDSVKIGDVGDGLHVSTDDNHTPTPSELPKKRKVHMHPFHFRFGILFCHNVILVSFEYNGLTYCILL